MHSISLFLLFEPAVLVPLTTTFITIPSFPLSLPSFLYCALSPSFNEFHGHAMLNYTDCFHFQWLQSYVRGLRERASSESEQSGVDEGRGSALPRVDEPALWHQHSPSFCLMRKRKARVTGPLFISLTLLPWVFVCECTDMKTGRDENSDDKVPHQNIKQTWLCKMFSSLWCVFSCRLSCATHHLIARQRHERQKMLLWPFFLCWET